MRRAVAGLVLAAGASTRMGPETNKLLEEVDDEALVCRPVDALLDAGASPVFVVTGYQAEGLHEALGTRSVRFVHHADWPSGMGSSLACGIHALMACAAECEGVLIALGDLPGLRSEIARQLRERFDRAGASAICVPVHAGRRGHPVLFGARHFEELGAMGGESGARELFERHADCVIEVEIESDAPTADIDTPDDLRRMRALGTNR